MAKENEVAWSAWVRKGLLQIHFFVAAATSLLLYIFLIVLNFMLLRVGFLDIE